MPRTPRAGALPGRYKSDSDDFVVEEVPLYEPCGEGSHTYLWIEKRGRSTFDAIAALARALGRRDRDFGVAGLKDARAVTRQWVSIEDVPPASVEGLQLDGVVVLAARAHTNKLKLGHLRGNRFRITVVGAGAEHVGEAEQRLSQLADAGVPNYFGVQRFGKRGANLDKGLRILRGNPRKAARTMPRRLLGLVVSAVQSEVFNRVLTARIATCDQLLEGDVAWLHRNGACFVVEDAAAEAPRAAAFEVSPSGPLPGPDLLAATGEAGRIEAEAMAALDLSAHAFARVPGKRHAGARRPLRVPLIEPRVRSTDRGLELAFELPRGSYATAVLDELLVDAPWFGDDAGR